MSQWCHIVHSCNVHPCHIVLICPLLQIPSLQHGADVSTPAFSTPPFLTVPLCPLPQIPSTLWFISHLTVISLNYSISQRQGSTFNPKHSVSRHQLSVTLCLQLQKVWLPSPLSRHIWKLYCLQLLTIWSNMSSAVSASDSNSQHMVTPINVFDIDCSARRRWQFILFPQFILIDAITEIMSLVLRVSNVKLPNRNTF